MKVSTVLPTAFAIDLAIESGLLPAPRVMQNAREYDSIILRLRQFQQMAISSTLEESKCAFYSFDLTEVMEDALHLIHSSTCQWLRGHVTGVMLERLEDGRTGNRDFAEAMRMVVEALKAQEPIDDGNPHHQRKGLMITLTSDGNNYGS